MTRWGGSARVVTAFALALTVALGALQTACTPEEAAPAGRTLLYGFPMLPPEPDAGPDAAVKAAQAAESLARTTADAVTARMKAMGWDDVTVTTRAARDLRIRLPAELTDQVGLVRAVVERTGALEIRLRATPAVENACRPLNPADYPAGYRRLPRAEPPDQYVVVEAPEDLPPDPASPPSDNVYVASDLESIEAVVEGGDNVLTFEMRPERKASFTEFSRRNLERSVAIAIDGIVVSAPVIKSVLPGSGKIARDGEGFSRQDAKSLAAILGHVLPCRLAFIAME